MSRFVFFILKWMRILFRGYEPPVSLGRKLLQVDRIGKRQPRYATDIANRNVVVPKRGTVPHIITEAEDIWIPTFTIASNPTLRYQENSFIRRAKKLFDAWESMTRQENIEVVKAINASVPDDHAIATPQVTVTPDILNKAISCIEEHNTLPAAILLTPQSLRIMREWPAHMVRWYSRWQRIRTGAVASYMGIPVYCSMEIPKNVVYVTAPPHTLGVLALRTDFKWVRANAPTKLRDGYVVYTDMGVGILFNYGVARILLDTPPSEAHLTPPPVFRSDNPSDIIPEERLEGLKKAPPYSNRVNKSPTFDTENPAEEIPEATRESMRIPL